MPRAAIEFTGDDLILHGGRYVDLEVGHARIVQWSEERVRAHEADLRRWERVGRPLTNALTALTGREILHDSLLGRAMSRFQIPRHKPADRSTLIRDSFVRVDREPYTAGLKVS